MVALLNTGGTFLAMRVDTKPFDDVRVRRALNMAVNKQEIVSSFYGGNAELFAYPQHPDYIGYFEPLEKMPEAARELFVYNPDKARHFWRRPATPMVFSFKVQVCACAPDHMDLLPLVSAYLEKVGVKIEIQPMEYGAFLSAMTTKTNAAGYFMQNGHTNRPPRSARASSPSRRGIRRNTRSRLRQEDGGGLSGAGREQASADAQGDDARDRRESAVYLAAGSLLL